jgi:hypothetical protein
MCRAVPLKRKIFTKRKKSEAIRLLKIGMKRRVRGHVSIYILRFIDGLARELRWSIPGPSVKMISNKPIGTKVMA